jgi:hypothetical protein
MTLLQSGLGQVHARHAAIQLPTMMVSHVRRFCLPQLKIANDYHVKSGRLFEISGFGRQAILFATSTAGAVIVGVCIYLASRGIDLTDESFYILWARAPKSYGYAGTFFGHLLSPLFELVGQNIVRYRRAGLLILSLLGVLGWLSWSRREPVRPLALAMMSVGVAALPLYYMAPAWITTPSYDWLGVVAGLVLFASLGLLLRDEHRWRAAVLAAVAGMCAAISRPPAGAAFALIYVAGIAVAATSLRRCVVNLLIAATATISLALIIAIFVVDVEVIGRQITAFLELWSGSYQPSVFAQQIELAKRMEDGPLLLLELVVFGAALVARLHGGVWYRHVATIGILVVIILTVCAGGLSLSTNWRLNFLPTHAALAVNTTALLVGHGSWRRHVMLALAALIPWVSFLGTGSYYPKLAPQLAGVSVVIILIALGEVLDLTITAMAAFVLLTILGWTLSGVISAPYRLPTDLWSQSQRFDIPQHGSVWVDPSTNAMFAQLSRAAAVNGFAPGQPVLDLTGQSPGLVMVLGGRPPVTPWLVGGYDWSDRLLRFVLAGMDLEERRKAWLLWGGPRAFSETLLRELGFDLERNYRLVATVNRAGTAWNVLLFAPRQDRSNGRD